MFFKMYFSVFLFFFFLVLASGIKLDLFVFSDSVFLSGFLLVLVLEVLGRASRA